MATNRPTLSITGEKQHNVKSAVAGKSKASKARSRNETYAEKLDNSVRSVVPVISVLFFLNKHVCVLGFVVARTIH